MAIAYTRQLPQKDCLNLLATCAYCPEEREDHFTMPTGVDGLSLQAACINTYKGEVVRETTFHAAADTTLHFFKSEYRDYFYITEYNQYRQQFKCSCAKRFCDHIRQLSPAA
jgi:hypothetical protein